MRGKITFINKVNEPLISQCYFTTLTASPRGEAFFIFYGNGHNSLPCVKGGGFCEAKDGGIVGYGVTVAVIIIKLKTQSLSRLRRQLPLHKGAFFHRSVYVLPLRFLYMFRLLFRCACVYNCLPPWGKVSP